MMNIAAVHGAHGHTGSPCVVESRPRHRRCNHRSDPNAIPRPQNRTKVFRVSKTKQQSRQVSLSRGHFGAVRSGGFQVKLRVAPARNAASTRRRKKSDLTSSKSRKGPSRLSSGWDRGKLTKASAQSARLSFWPRTASTTAFSAINWVLMLAAARSSLRASQMAWVQNTECTSMRCPRAFARAMRRSALRPPCSFQRRASLSAVSCLPPCRFPPPRRRTVPLYNATRGSAASVTTTAPSSASGSAGKGGAKACLTDSPDPKRVKNRSYLCCIAGQENRFVATRSCAQRSCLNANSKVFWKKKIVNYGVSRTEPTG
eukprot:m.294491 g.294491  ORF g.294491 m.294491 type:complete len:315 (+) comp19503_c0_seq1:193-1137(+)